MSHRFFRVSVVLSALVGLLLAVAVGCDDGSPARECTTSGDCGDDEQCLDGRCVPTASDGDADGDVDGDADGDSDGDPDADACPSIRDCDDECCPEGQICAGGHCCAPDELCGAVCCGPGHACAADRCVLACEDEETPCGSGDEASCCPAGVLCYLEECTEPGGPCDDNWDCPEGEYCETTVGFCLPIAEGTEECEYRPPVTGELELVEEWHWSGDPTVLSTHNQVMMAPMVANLNDDNGDGAINEHDIPDVVFQTFRSSTYRSDGILRAISGADGSRHWPTSDPGYRTTPGSEIAIADVDFTSPGPEILVCSSPRETGRLMLVAADGRLIRTFDTPPNDIPCGVDAPAVADMDGDGVPELVVRWVIAHADGTVVRRIRDDYETSGAYVTLADLDDDDDLELVSPSGVYDMDGTAFWERVVDAPGRPALLGRAFIAVGDLDLDGSPELITVTMNDHSIRALDPLTGDEIWGPIDINPPEMAAEVAANGNPNGGGPPTIANFDADPNPEIAFAGGFAYVIFEHDGSRSWWFETTDRSSRQTGSSIFDFEGDGVAEVLYNDEHAFRVFRGPDGSILYDQCNTSGTITEYPIVVDVDNDDHAEIVLMENNYSRGCLDGTPGTTGIHAFGHPRAEWVRTRRIWNQHTYHITNINEDGTVPRREERNWEVAGFNNFRQNLQPEGLFDAPDLVPIDLHASTGECPEALAVTVRVVNRGRAGAPEGIPVTFYLVGTGSIRTWLARTYTTRPLLPGESELLSLEPPYPVPSGMETDVFQFEAVVNDPDDEPVDWLHECRDDNNTAGPIEASCPTIG